ncbi:ATP-binding cassette domain-containing protein [Blautia massiliensis (ex Durand et al. 2017)]|uniref:ATP-binding cassette domain-containing protein n=1 Tax=Blautia massiliensis (ex Durand et al. 2017) TaxID=1737424 RepID=UPI0039953654
MVGESGSGKTTVIRAVLGALAGGGRVSTGDIQFHGHSLLSNTKDEWRNLRGYPHFHDLPGLRRNPEPYP